MHIIKTDICPKRPEVKRQFSMPHFNYLLCLCLLSLKFHVAYTETHKTKLPINKQ